MTKSFTKLFSAIAFVLFAAALSGQTTFSVTPSEAHVDWGNWEATSTIKNLTNQDIIIRWEKSIYVQNNDSACWFGVTSPFVHYPPHITARNEYFPPYYEGVLGARLGGCFPDTNQICVVVTLLMYDLAHPTDTVYGVYTFGNCPAVSTSEANKSPMIAYPNPVDDILTLNTDNQAVGFRLFNSIGKYLDYFIASPNQQYDISPYPPGHYILVAEDKNHQFLQALKIQKR